MRNHQRLQQRTLYLSQLLTTGCRRRETCRLTMIPLTLQCFSSQKCHLPRSRCHRLKSRRLRMNAKELRVQLTSRRNQVRFTEKSLQVATLRISTSLCSPENAKQSTSRQQTQKVRWRTLTVLCKTLARTLEGKRSGPPKLRGMYTSGHTAASARRQQRSRKNSPRAQGLQPLIIDGPVRRVSCLPAARAMLLVDQALERVAGAVPGVWPSTLDSTLVRSNLLTSGR